MDKRLFSHQIKKKTLHIAPFIGSLETARHFTEKIRCLHSNNRGQESLEKIKNEIAVWKVYSRHFQGRNAEALQGSDQATFVVLCAVLGLITEEGCADIGNLQ